jgi:RNA polymerase sigma factor (sigma-70 family)
VSANEESSDLAAVFTAIGPQLRRFLLGVTKDAHAADDAMQSAFAKALEKPPTGTHDGVKAWFFKVAFNEVLAARRKGERFRKALGDIGWLRRLGTDQRDDADEMKRVQKEIERLPEEQKFVLRQRFVEGKTFAKIAEEQRLPLGTVLTRMRLAMERLRANLKD